jgi:transcription elongation regulator 1
MKRKVEDVVPLSEVTISKRTKLDPDEDGGEDDSDNSSEEEEWQREAAAQLAAEAEEEQKRQELERIQAELESQKAKETKTHNMPERVDLSLDEAKALFKVLYVSHGNSSESLG